MRARLCSECPPVEGGTGRKQGVSLQRCSFSPDSLLSFPAKVEVRPGAWRDQIIWTIEVFRDIELTKLQGSGEKKIILWRTKPAADWIIALLIYCGAVTDEQQRGENVIIQWSQHAGKRKSVCECDTQCELCILVTTKTCQFQTDQWTRAPWRSITASEQRGSRDPSANCYSCLCSYFFFPPLISAPILQSQADISP